VKKRKFRQSSKLGVLSITIALSVVALATIALAAGVSYFQGFETDTGGWTDATRVSSGTHGILSATGSWHAESTGGTLNASGAFTRWGGYGGNAGCATSACAAAIFPSNGYITSIDVYLDVDSLTTTNDTRFDFSSAINGPSGAHRRDFVFNAGFYNDTDVTGSGPRFVITASTNATRSGAFPKDPGKDPFAITDGGWYTFQHTFTDNGSGVLTVEFAIKNEAGTTLKTWIRSDPSDTINGTVGSNRYGWFALQEFPVLAFDNSSRFDIMSQPADKEQCKNDGWKLVVNGANAPFKNQGACVKFVLTGK
jgi:hypothetical protein